MNRQTSALFPNLFTAIIYNVAQSTSEIKLIL